ncbi:hypothetical protein PRZ48_009848 [Zasmidium cellare]|uniref:Heterokaryon incompatibility domain-containing protein n=1 Tax=Zasmidium cellare TaxID=395010 RepID=A0ABR0EDW9_ZASCE|nr:hypothetical protein PRZ48_009848 [Zasmidium cellare]
MAPRLLNTTTLTFEAPPDLASQAKSLEKDSERPYAILSHRWAVNSDHEIRFEEIGTGYARYKPGFSKVEGAARKAREYGFDWIWIDTCCIDKRNNNELAEAINSMFRWYRDAACCFAYLQDVGPGSNKTLCDSEWFTRGWTLQELIAPKAMEFFDCEWTHLGSKTQLASDISQRTGIHIDVLLDSKNSEDSKNSKDCNDSMDHEKPMNRKIDNYSIAQKMTWIAGRQTSKDEDMAYCLLGIFDINMAPIYGEQKKALIRLQEELIRTSDDHTIFAWSMDPSAETKLSGLLALSHEHFKHCSGLRLLNRREGRMPFSITNRGLSIELEITPWTMDTYLAFIDCEQPMKIKGFMRDISAGVFLRRLKQNDQYARIDLYGNGGLYWDIDGVYHACRHRFHPRPSRIVRLFIPKAPDSQSSSTHSAVGRDGFWIPARLLQGHEGTHGDVYIPIPNPCQLEICQLREGLRFKQIALGFDFGFNPVCMLVDSGAENELVGPISTFCDGDEEIHGKKYDTIIERSCVYSHGKPHDGIWRLRCDRRREMNVALKVSLSHNGPNLLMHREDGTLMWNVDIEHAESEQDEGEDSDPHAKIMDLMDAEILETRQTTPPSNATTAPPHLQTTPSAGFSTTLNPNGTGLNSTNSSADAYADACNSASNSFLSKYASTTLVTSGTDYYTFYTYTFIPPDSTPYTTLCDGYPRAHGTPVFSPVTVTHRDLNAFPVTTWDTATATPPACTINPSQCSRLYSSFENNGFQGSYPACSYTEPACSTSASTCYISAQSVQMAYWPVSVTGDPCGNRTTVPPTVTTPQTASVFGTTVVSPNVLLSFNTLILEDGCTNPVSTVTNYILEQRPDQISSQRGEYHNGYGGGFSFNFGDFQPPVPASAYLAMAMCGGGGGGFSQYCSTIWDAFTPQLAIPTAVQSAAPGFAGCGFLDDLNIVFDPPIALTAAAQEALPTLPGGSSPTSATAIPEKTPQPSQAPATSSKGELKPTTPPAAQPAPSDSPSPANPAPSNQNGNSSPSNPSNENGTNDPSSPSNQNGDSSSSPQPGQNGGSNQSTPSSQNGNSDPSSPHNPSSPSNQNGNSDPQSPSNQNGGSDLDSPSPAQNPPSGTTEAANIGGIIASVVGASSASAAQNGDGSVQDPGSAGSDQEPAGSSNGAVTTVGSIPLSVAPDQSAVVIDGTATLAPGQATVINQTPVAVGSSGQVVVGSSTVNLVAPSQTGSVGSGAVLTLGGSTVTASSLSGGGVVLQGQTMAAGKTAVVDGQTVSVGPSGIVVNGATQAFSPLGSAATPASAAIITAGGQTMAAQASAGTVILDGTMLTPGQVATINGAVVSDASSGLVVDGTTALFTSNSGSLGQVAPITALMRFGSQTITAIESAGTAVISGTTLTPGQIATVDGHTVSDVSSGLVVDGTTSLWNGGSGPVTQIMDLGNQDITVTESAGTATIDSSITLRPGDTTTIDGHMVSDASSGLVIDGKTTSFFAHAAAASTTVVTIGSHTYTATEEGNGVLVVDGHTLSPGDVATIGGQTISDASGKIVQATPTFASASGGANAAPAAAASTGGAGAIRVGWLGVMTACWVVLVWM